MSVIAREGKNSGGGRFSKRSASPGPPPEEWLGIGLSFPAYLCAHASWARIPASLVVVTAAARAAATLRHGERNPSARPRRAEGFIPTRCMSAAALSVAVDSTKSIGEEPHAQAEPSKQKAALPNASRSSGEGVWGRGASLREAASPPESPQRNLFGREREGGGFSSEKPPPSHMISLYILCIVCVRRGAFGAAPLQLR